MDRRDPLALVVADGQTTYCWTSSAQVRFNSSLPPPSLGDLRMANGAACSVRLTLQPTRTITQWSSMALSWRIEAPPAFMVQENADPSMYFNGVYGCMDGNGPCERLSTSNAPLTWTNNETTAIVSGITFKKPGTYKLIAWTSLLALDSTHVDLAIGTIVQVAEAPPSSTSSSSTLTYVLAIALVLLVIVIAFKVASYLRNRALDRELAITIENLPRDPLPPPPPSTTTSKDRSSILLRGFGRRESNASSSSSYISVAQRRAADKRSARNTLGMDTSSQSASKKSVSSTTSEYSAHDI